MTDTEELPEDWGDLIRFRGYTSLRDFAKKNSLSHSTLSRAFRGQNILTDENAIATARALGISTEELWRRLDHQPSEPYTPPQAARYLSKSQRVAVDAVIAAMLENVADQIAEDQPNNVTALPTRNPAPPLDSETLAANRGPKGPDEDQPNE